MTRRKLLRLKKNNLNVVYEIDILSIFLLSNYPISNRLLNRRRTLINECTLCAVHD